MSSSSRAPLHPAPASSLGPLNELSCAAEESIQRALRQLQEEHPDCDFQFLSKRAAEEAIGHTATAVALASEILGYAKLAERLARERKFGDRNNNHTGMKQSSCSPPAQFKVPAPRRPSPPAQQQQPQQPQQAQSAAQPEQQQQQQQQQRRHSAPKRRPTPQVWEHGPICITPTAPPSSGMHGEACCDATLLPCWCPMSGKRLKTDPQLQADTAAAGSQPGPQQQQPQQPAAAYVEQPVASPAAAATVSNSSMPRASSSSTVPPARSTISSARRDAIEDVQRSMHEDPASKPAADVLLFHKATQLPVVNWSGPIKHKANGRVVELCSLSLQVPEAFLEEFPRALYAAELRHRKTVSLGRHVVCRASLSALSEHQLATLAAMARAQLVAVCMLQTAELHLVPYHDNKNHVRCVGFLKIKPT